MPAYDGPRLHYLGPPQVLELCTAAKRTAASLSGLFSGASSGTASSFTLLNTKAMYLGRARGRLHELSKRLGRDAALERLTREACASAGRGQASGVRVGPGNGLATR